MKGSSINTIIICSLFVGYYFYLDFIGVDKLISIPVIGIFIGLAYYFLSRFSNPTSRILAAFFITSVFIFVSVFLKTSVSTSGVTKELLGNWQTDTSGGFSVNVNIKSDSAYLSQSNLNLITSYAIAVVKDSLNLSNTDLRKNFDWKFSLSKNGQNLCLFNEVDSLIFRKLNEN